MVYSAAYLGMFEVERRWRVIAGGGADHVDKVVSVSGDGGVMFVE